jgi:predicted negative regulator of RcsB-dependent stress response
MHLLEGELAKTQEEKQKADKAAEAVLLDLRKSRPELAPIIDDQLAALVPEDRPISQLNTLMLQGVMGRGTAEYKKTDEEKPNLRVMQRAIDAAREILARQGKDKDVTPQAAADASILIPTLLDRTGHPIEAVNGYLDYAEHFQKLNSKVAGEALDRAGYLVFEMKKRDPAPAGFTDAYGRFLRIAIAAPFNHKELAYLMGEHLQAQGKEAEALTFYQQVPKESGSYLNAQYKSMLCLRDLLEENNSPQQHKRYVDELLKAANTVKELGMASKEQVDRAKAVQSTLVYAQLARTEQKDPKASLKTLENFESLVKGLPGEKGLLSEALFERVQAQMDLAQFDQATALLVDLLNKTEGNEGMGLVRQLLEELDQQFQKADIAHDNDKMRTIARNEAQLTGFLGDWAKNNKDPNISRFYYAYEVYDARTKRLAATLTDEPTERRKLLEETLKLYQNLQNPAMHELYVKTLDAKKIASGDINPKDPDPSVQIGVAFTDFELGDYKPAQSILGDLLANQKLGPPTLVEPSPDGVKTKVNDLYWEATYKLLKSNAEIARANKDKSMMDNTVRGLKNILIRGGIPVRWEDEFESLRKDIAPDFTPATNPSIRK